MLKQAFRFKHLNNTISMEKPTMTARPKKSITIVVDYEDGLKPNLIDLDETLWGGKVAIIALGNLHKKLEDKENTTKQLISKDDLRELISMWNEAARLSSFEKDMPNNANTQTLIYQECADDLKELLSGNKEVIARMIAKKD